MSTSSPIYGKVPWVDTTNTTSTQSSAKTTGTTNLGKDDFLKLMFAELKNQDPLKPMDNSQSIAEMAQFSSLEQMSNLNTTLSKFSDNMTNTLLPILELQQMTNMIGRQASYFSTTDDGTTNIKTGTINSVTIQNGVPNYVINGENIAASDITDWGVISPTSDTTTK